ncbi:MAG: inositol monophosphatase family protein [Actinomycetota bacterium]
MTDVDFDVDRYRDDVTALVRVASRRSLEWFRQPVAVENKLSEGFDPVTEADRAVEDEIRAELAARFPGHAILGEERGESGSSRYRWVIDPIDGTRAFISGQPMWGTLVGLQVDGMPVAGWMHLPVTDETHVATPAGGWLHRLGRKTEPRVSTTTAAADAILLCTHPEMFEPGPQEAGFERLAAACRLVRFSGDCANYGLLAAGHVDLVVENGLAPYDILPLLPIVEAAGGVITNLDGAAPVDGGFVVAAATPELHAAALGLLTARS